MNRKKQNQQSNSFLLENPEYHLKYNELLKESRIWNNSAQYWLGQEALRRAHCLLRGDVDGYKTVKHSHVLSYPCILNNMI